ncbi:MAG: redoxin family protein [Saprospiraceae bacterium]|nr:redoxin family protein [Saprospiraceae bacterium]
MKYIFSLLLVAAIFVSSEAQNGCEIRVRLDNYTFDTLWFGTTVGKRIVPDFSAVKQADGTFLLKTDKSLEQGMYAIIYKRAANTVYQSFQVWLVEGERKFTLNTGYFAPYETPIIAGSPENEQLYRYLREFRVADAKLDEALTRWRYLQDEKSWQDRVAAEEEFRKFQDDFIKTAKPGLTTNLVSQTLLPLPPASAKPSANLQEEVNARWLYQRAHFFDKMNIATPDFLRHPQWLDRADFFLLNLPPPHPDTTKVLCDLIFKKLEAYPDGYNYYQKYIVNSLAKMSQYRLDEVYVYLVRNYLSTGKATWATPNDVQMAHNSANNMERLFNGLPAPNFIIGDRDNNPHALYDVKAQATLLIFYMPDCSHCRLELPIIAKLYEKYKEKGLQVVTVCLKTGDDTPKCWEFLDTQNFPKEWLFLADKDRKANLVSYYNIKGYPRLLLLDSDKKILFKRSGESSEWQLDSILGKYLK